MAGRALAVQKSKDIGRLAELGLSDRAIARALKINRRSVRKYREAIEAPAVAADLRTTPEAWQDKLDWGPVIAEVRKGTPVQVLWEELKEQGQVPVQYSAFWKQLRRRVPNLEATMVRVFAPGDRCEVDYADGIDIYEPFSGELRSTHLFVGVLCHSRFIFAEFSFSQKSEDFLSSHVRMFQAFSGVPQIVAIDYVAGNIIRDDPARYAAKKLKGAAVAG